MKKLLVEEAHLVERFAAEEEGRSHRPVDVTRLAPSGLDDPDAPEREQPSAAAAGVGKRQADA